MATDNLRIKVTVDGRQAEAEFDKLQIEAEELSTAGKNVGNSFSQSFANIATGLNQSIELLKKGIGFAKGFVDVALVQVDAEERLTNALSEQGLATEDNFSRLQNFASELQKVTTVGDETTLGLLEMAVNLGVGSDKLEGVTRNAVGLAERFGDLGLTQEQALKGLALAQQGNFETLGRYIPALRSINSETEKTAFLQRTAAEGFELAKRNADTTQGRITRLVNAWGDLNEEIGKIALGVFVGDLNDARGAIETFTDLIKDNSDTIVNSIKPFVDFGKIVGSVFINLATVVKDVTASIGQLAGQFIFDIKNNFLEFISIIQNPIKALSQGLLAQFKKDEGDITKAYGDILKDLTERSIESFSDISKAWGNYKNNIEKPIETTVKVTVTAKTKKDEPIITDIEDELRGIEDTIIQPELNIEPIIDTDKTISTVEDKLGDLETYFHQMANSMSESFQQIFEGMTEGNGEEVSEGIKNFFKGIINTTLDAVEAQIIAGRIAAIAEAFAASLNPFTAIATGLVKVAPIVAAFEVAKAGINGLIGSFATGGLVQGGQQLIQVNEEGQEFVMNARAVNALGVGTLEAMNANPSGFMRGLQAPSGNIENSIVQALRNISLTVVDNSTTTSQFEFESFEREQDYRVEVEL